jgi:hypothetical protein
MGNRAMIVTKEKTDGLYLHWNGGRDSVEGFLKYCELQGFRSPETDGYGWARLCQIVGNFFGGSLSVGMSHYSADTKDWMDNGVYIIENWKIVEREFDGSEQREYPLNEVLEAIDEKQPKHMQLGDILKAKKTKVSNLNIGDSVLYSSFDGQSMQKIVGFGTDRIINGYKVLGIPYTAKYKEDNPNAYVFPDNNGEILAITV